ncbi:hypothetical protein [Asticcacaulis sp.]|uniref:hypothetical protein n=1 Tax=Asticcacaulis sp. TaxID=1872648 RepID=UPI00391B6D7F
MARIRSVHPSLFTDADWVECSPMARLLIIGLWTHADDQGLFVWRPKEIKMSLMPGDDVNVASLLTELTAAGLIRGYEVDGKAYGAIKNFRKWQRPQKPTPIHPLTAEIAAFVGLPSDTPTQPPPDGPVPVRDSSATATGKPIQMEDVGGIGEGVRVSNETLTLGAREIGFEVFRKAYPKRDGLSAAKRQWDAAVKGGAPPGDIIAGLRRCIWAWQESQTAPRFIPNAARWLSERRWEDEAAEPANDTVRPQVVWTGPPEIRAELVAAESEAFARSYLDHAEWDAEAEAIVPNNGFAYDKLRRLRCMEPYLLPPSATAILATGGTA